MRNNKFEDANHKKPFEIMAEELILEMRTQAEFEFETSLQDIKLFKDFPEEALEMMKHIFVTGTLFGYMKTLEKLKIKFNIIL